MSAPRVTTILFDPSDHVSRPQMMAELFTLEELAMECGHAPSHERMEAVRLQRRAVLAQFDQVLQTLQAAHHQLRAIRPPQSVAIVVPGGPVS